MRRILSKSTLIAIALLILFSVGCAKRAIPDTIATVEQTWFAFEQREITYDELKEKISGYYADFDQTVGEKVFWPGFKDSKEILYKELAGLTWDDFFIDRMGGDADWREQMKEEGQTVTSSQVSVSTSVDAVRDQQMAFAWREDTVEGRMPNTSLMIFSNRYFFSKVKGQWKIDRIDLRGGGYAVSADEATRKRQREYATHPYQDEAEYVRTITLK